MTTQTTKLRVLPKQWDELGNFDAWIEGENGNFFIIQKPAKADEEGNYSVALQKEGSDKPLKLQVFPGTTPVIIQIHEDEEELPEPEPSDDESFTEFSAKDLAKKYLGLVNADEDFSAWLDQDGEKMFLVKAPQHIIKTNKYRLTLSPKKGSTGDVSTVDVSPNHMINTNASVSQESQETEEEKPQQKVVSSPADKIKELAHKLDPLEMIELAQALIGQAKSQLTEAE